jgi:hypothetical protein
MKTIFSIIAVVSILSITSSAQEYKVVTAVESIVPMGIGRSRMVDHLAPSDYRSLTTERTDGRKSNQDEIRREDVKIDHFEETKLVNFYSAAGINFQNIASNDAVMSSKLSELAKEGWTLVFVTSGVESHSGEHDGNGIFITRYIFKRDQSTAALGN